MIKTWTMRDGTEIAIKDMTDSHLLNTINMLERNISKNRLAMELSILSNMAGLQGEMAQVDADRGLTDMVEASDEELLTELTPYGSLVWHARRRGLLRKEKNE